MDGRQQIIVCGIDGSSAGQRALEWAIDEAKRREARLRVVTAWTWDGIESMGAASSPATALARASEIQEGALSRAFTTMESTPDVERLFLRDAASEALCTAALDADLLVLGSHGHGAVHEKLVGSTSQRAIHHAPCPVVILPDPRHVEKELKHAKAKHRTSEPPRAIPMF